MEVDGELRFLAKFPRTAVAKAVKESARAGLVRGVTAGIIPIDSQKIRETVGGRLAEILTVKKGMLCELNLVSRSTVSSRIGR